MVFERALSLSLSLSVCSTLLQALLLKIISPLSQWKYLTENNTIENENILFYYFFSISPENSCVDQWNGVYCYNNFTFLSTSEYLFLYLNVYTLLHNVYMLG